LPPPPDERPSPAGETLPASAPLTIWLIEDNPADAFVMTEALKSSGLSFQLRSVVDGEAALDLLRGVEEGEQVLPALVLLDLNLPKTSGIEVLSHIRGAARCSRVPIIVVTSSEAPADLGAIRELSATAYFRKPTDLDAFMKLSDVIRDVLRS
jgi:two-component system, chemotaxis family, response regulator Rcp1